jgi:chromosome segregation ATPase
VTIKGGICACKKCKNVVAKEGDICKTSCKKVLHDGYCYNHCKECQKLAKDYSSKFSQWKIAYGKWEAGKKKYEADLKKLNAKNKALGKSKKQLDQNRDRLIEKQIILDAAISELHKDISDYSKMKIRLHNLEQKLKECEKTPESFPEYIPVLKNQISALKKSTNDARLSLIKKEERLLDKVSEYRKSLSYYCEKVNSWISELDPVLDLFDTLVDETLGRLIFWKKTANDVVQPIENTKNKVENAHGRLKGVFNKDVKEISYEEAVPASPPAKPEGAPKDVPSVPSVPK